ncbi:MAG: 50S ribosomal protein L20 [Patescibacteria group bacterium]|mgnify:CR=1 FL=1
MSRVTYSVQRRARHKKWLKRAKGFRGRRSTVYKIAKEAVLKAGQHAFHDRRKKKTNIRAVWQVRINSAVRKHGLSYSKFIQGLRKHKVALDRKILSQLAATHPDIFEKIVERVK